MNTFSIALYAGASVLGLGSFALVYLTFRNLSDEPAPAVAGHANFDIESSARRSRRLLRQFSISGELSPTHVSGEVLTATAASLGFANLEFIARRITEGAHDLPYLFGVNRGGALLANLLSQRLGLTQKHLVRCDYRKDWDRVICEPRPNVRRIIIVDDVVRTGTTIRAVKDYLRQTNPDAIVDAISLVAVVSKEDEAVGAFDVIDYAAWISRIKSIRLPWSNSAEENPTDYFDTAGMEQIVGRLMEHSKKVVNE